MDVNTEFQVDLKHIDTNFDTFAPFDRGDYKNIGTCVLSHASNDINTQFIPI